MMDRLAPGTDDALLIFHHVSCVLDMSFDILCYGSWHLLLNSRIEEGKSAKIWTVGKP